MRVALPMVASGVLAAAPVVAVIVPALQVDEWHHDRVTNVAETEVRGTPRPG